MWRSVLLVAGLVMAVTVVANPVSRQVGYSEDIKVTVKNNNEVCIIDGVVYEQRAYLPTVDPCERCQCAPPGFACTVIECEVKPGCQAIRHDNQCCPEYRCDCERDGVVYRAGERVEDPANPCEECYCSGGEIECRVVRCPWRADCEGRHTQGVCCASYSHCPSQDVQETHAETPEVTTVMVPLANEAVEDEAGTAVDETVTVIPDTDAAPGGQDAAVGAEIKAAADDEAAGSVSGPPSANETQTSPEDAGLEPVKRTNGTAEGEAAPLPEEDAVEDTTAEIDAVESSTLTPLGGQSEDGETVDSAASNSAPVREASVADTHEDTDTSSTQGEVTDPDAKPATNGSQTEVNTKSNEDTTVAPTDVVEGDASDADTPPAQGDAQANASESLTQVIRADGNASEPATAAEEQASSPTEASEADAASPSQGAEEEDPSQGVTELITRANDDPTELQGAVDATAADTPAEDATVLPFQKAEVDESEAVTMTLRETNEDTTESSLPMESAVAEATDEEGTEEGTASSLQVEAQESLPDDFTEASVDVTGEQTDSPLEDASIVETVVESTSTDEAPESSVNRVEAQGLAEQNSRVNEDTTEESAPATGEETQVDVEASVDGAEPESGTAPPSEVADVEAIEETTIPPAMDAGGEGETVKAAVAENATEADTATSDAETSQKRTAGSAGLVKVSVNGQTYHELPSAQQVSSDDKGEGNPGNDYWLKTDQETPEQEAEKEFEKVAEKYGLRPAANANAQDFPAEKQYASELEAPQDDNTDYFTN